MKRMILGGLAISALLVAAPLSIANAKKAPPPPPPPPAPVYSWTSCYVGGNIGYSWGNANNNYNEPAFAGVGLASISESEKLDGLIGGGQIGCDWQANSTWVFGLETDLQGSGEKGSAAVTNAYVGVIPDPSVTLTNNADIQWFGTVRGRIGWLINPTLMLYGTGGLAYGGIDASGSVTNSATGHTWLFNNSTTQVGWTAGAGLEGAVPNTSN